MALAELRGQLQQTETGIKQSTEEASAFKNRIGAAARGGGAAHW